VRRNYAHLVPGHTKGKKGLNNFARYFSFFSASLSAVLTGNIHKYNGKIGINYLAGVFVSYPSWFNVKTPLGNIRRRDETAIVEDPGRDFLDLAIHPILEIGRAHV